MPISAATSGRKPTENQKIKKQALDSTPDNTTISDSRIKTLLIFLYAVQFLREGKELPDSAYDSGLFSSAWSVYLNKFFPGLADAALSIDKSRALDYDTLVSIYNGLKKFHTFYSNYPAQLSDAVTMLGYFKLTLRNPNDESPTTQSAMRALNRNSAAMIFPHWVSKMYSEAEVEDNTPIHDYLTRIVHKYTGRHNDPFFATPEEINDFAKKNPKEFSQWKKFNAQFKRNWKDYIAAYVRNYGIDGKCTYAEVRRSLEENGYPHGLPEGFNGLIDASSRLYIEAVPGEFKKLAGEIPEAGFFPSIQMNPKGVGFKAIARDGTAIAKDMAGSISTTKQRLSKKALADRSVYTEEHTSQAMLEKFRAVRRFEPIADRVRRKWLHQLAPGSHGGMITESDIQNAKNSYFPLDRNQLTALALELIWQTAGRVGNDGNATAGEETFGITTLRKSMLKISGNKVIISYRGKSGVEIAHGLDPSKAAENFATRNEVRLLIECLKVQMANNNSELLFESKPGPKTPLKERRITQGFRLTNTIINNALRAYNVPAGITIHSFRTLHATRMFDAIYEDFLRKNRSTKSLTYTEARKMLGEMAFSIGAKLGHARNTGEETEVETTTAINNYIDYSSQLKFYDRFKVRIPPNIQRAMGRSLSNTDPEIVEDEDLGDILIAGLIAVDGGSEMDILPPLGESSEEGISDQETPASEDTTPTDEISSEGSDSTAEEEVSEEDPDFGLSTGIDPDLPSKEDQETSEVITDIEPDGGNDGQSSTSLGGLNSPPGIAQGSAPYKGEEETGNSEETETESEFDKQDRLEQERFEQKRDANNDVKDLLTDLLTLEG